MMQAFAMVSAEDVSPTAIAPYARELFEDAVVPELPRIADQVVAGHYPGGDTTVSSEAARLETLLETCRTRQLDLTLTAFLKECADKAVLRGHASDGLASLFETLRVPPRR